MKTVKFCALVLVLGFLLTVDAWSQRPGRGNGNPDQTDQTNQNNQDPNQDQEDKDKEPEVKLPDDPRLLKIHEQFVLNAEKLGAEYIKDNKFDQARACYEEIVRLVPKYAKGKELLDTAIIKQSTAEKKVVSIMATEGWQDTGIVVAEGEPVVIQAHGSWNFRLAHEVTADGMPIPKDLRDFNLGA